MKTISNTKTKGSAWAEIKNVLSERSAQELIKLVGDLYALSKANKDFLAVKFLPNDNALENYKGIIQKYLAPSEPWKKSQQVSIKEAKKALEYYRKATQDKIGLIDLMIHYVECGTDFLYKFGNMEESYYDSLTSVFYDVVTLMKKFDDAKMESFIDRLEVVLRKAADMGYGYGDSIAEIFEEAYKKS